MKILLADDEELQLIRLENAVKTVLPESEIMRYTNPALALKETENVKFDLAFLDIEMPVINGIALAKKLKQKNPSIGIVFVTAYTEYAIDAYKIHASGYVTKPVSAVKLKEEINALSRPVLLKTSKKIQVKCFGNFEVFSNGAPIKFARTKSKELFAYLVDREGAAVSLNEINAVLWEDKDRKAYCRNLVGDIKSTLKAVGAEDVFIKRRNECYIDPSKIDCDAYEYKNNDPDAVRSYRGEYMSQYPWAIFDVD